MSSQLSSSPERSNEERFALVGDVYAPENWQAIAKLLATVLKMPVADATSRAKRSHGFLAENLSGAQAEWLQQALESIGVAAHRMPAKDVVALPRPVRVHELWILDDALQVLAGQVGPREAVPWGRIVLIAASPVMKTEHYHHWQTTQDYRTSNLEVTSYAEDSVEWLVDLFASSAAGGFVTYRLMSREINYAEALGADRPDPNVVLKWRLASFCMLIGRMVARAGKAQVSAETVELLRAGPNIDRPRRNLHGLDDFDAYNRWLLQKICLAETGSSPV
jgi:hypothetical protein